MENEFYVVIDEDGVLRPMAFISPCDQAGEYRKESYKLSKGERIAKVKMEIID